MAISIDWPTKVIYVPKADMSQIQISPIEIRELDMDVFRLALKDLEDDADGIAWLDTHRHNPPVEIGGITLAMVIEIINDYTIEFEDGAYLVNIVGANNNVADRVVPNNVSVRSNNSAGLTVTTDILATDLSIYNTAGTFGKIIKQIKSLVAAGL